MHGPRHQLATRGVSVACVVAWVAFVAVAATVAADPPTSLDHSVQRLVGTAADRVNGSSGWPSASSGLLGRIGSAPVLALTVVVVGALLSGRRRRVRPTTFIALSYMLAVAVTCLFKRGFHRPEPYDSAVALGRSFPSGHTAGSVAVWGAIALLVWSVPELRRWTPAAVAIPAVVAMVMLIRSAHWMSDVLAGGALGAGCVATAALVTGRRDRPASGRATFLAWFPSNDDRGRLSQPSEQPT